MSAFEKAPKKYKWERAYPGILDAEEVLPDFDEYAPEIPQEEQETYDAITGKKIPSELVKKARAEESSKPESSKFTRKFQSGCA